MKQTYTQALIFHISALFLLIMPLITQAQQSIFDSGDIDLLDRIEETTNLYHCKNSNIKHASIEATPNTPSSVLTERCANASLSSVQSHLQGLSQSPCTTNSASVSYQYGTHGVLFNYQIWDNYNRKCQNRESFVTITATFIESTTIEECPETHPYMVQDKCANPVQIQANDTCNFNDVYSQTVTEPHACIVKNDGSKCAVSSVDIGNGQSVYMPTENDCYSDVYPTLDENGGLGELPLPDENQCTQSGALEYCPADPQDKCTETECESGCGYMNDQFICVAPIDDDNGDDTGDGDGDDTGDGDGDDTGNGDGNDTGNGDGDDTGNGNGNGGGNGNGQCTGGECVPCIDNDCSIDAGEKGSFDIEAAEAELEDMKEQLQNKMDQVREEFKTLIPAINGGTASFNTCFDITSVNGQVENRCLTEFADEMSVISKALLFLFTLIAALIVIAPNRSN